jgi:Zn-dependent protease with chaperone function
MFCLTATTLLIVPAFYRWWDGRRLRARMNDAVLAERWLAHVGRATRVTLTCMLMVPMLCPAWAIPGMLGVVLLSRAAAYPTRRALFGETWSLAGYLDWSVRLFVGWAGFWTLLAWVPYLVSSAGQRWPTVAAILLVALGVWQRWYPQVFLRMVRARTLEPGSVSTDFADGVHRVLEASHAPTPTLWRAGPPGAMVANALALPSLSGPSVLLSETLLEALTPSEATAIFAHEVAHLEHYSRRRLRWMTVGTLVLISCAVASAPLTARLAPNRLWIATALWPVAVGIAMALRGRHSQQHETASDRRAIELCGDAEAVASALVKLHARARIPRRWSPEVQQYASHPSLAKRLRDIRASAERPTPPAFAPVIVRGADRGVWIVIEADRVRYLSGVAEGTNENVSDLVAAAAAAVALPYEEVADLRVVSTGKVCRLHIARHDGRRFRCALRDADLPSVQSALDNVDQRITPATTMVSDPRARVAIVLSALVATLTVILGHAISLASIAVICLIRMTPASVTGLGAGSAAAAVTLFIDQSGFTPRVVSGTAAVVSVVLFWLARRLDKKARTDRIEPRWRQLSLAIGTLCTWIIVTVPATNLLMLHRLVVNMPDVVIFPAALAGTLWMARPRKRWSGAIASVLAAVPLLITSPRLVHWMIADAFLQSGPIFASRSAQLTPIVDADAPENASSLRLSRNGAGFIVEIDESDDEGWGRDDRRFVVGDFAGHQKEIVAVDAGFIDDRKVLVVSRTGTGLTLSLDSVDTHGPAAWQAFIDIRGTAALDVDPTSARWRVSGRTTEQLFAVEGTGMAVSSRSEWTIPADLRGRQWVSAGSGAAFAWGIDSPSRGLMLWPWLRVANISTIPFWTARFDALTADGPRLLGRTLQEAHCDTGPPGSAIRCFLTDGATTRIWQFGGEHLEFVGSINHRLALAGSVSSPRFVVWIDSRAALVDVERREIGWLTLPAGSFAYDWDVASDVIGAIVDDGDMTRIATFHYR